MRELHKKVLTVFTTAEVETRFPNILLEGGALSVVENPIRTCSPYPSPANNKAGQLRDVRVVDLVLPILICHLGHCLGGVEESGAGNTMMSLSSLDADGDWMQGAKSPST